LLMIMHKFGLSRVRTDYVIIILFIILSTDNETLIAIDLRFHGDRGSSSRQRGPVGGRVNADLRNSAEPQSI
jgi:hypothetical protein